MKKTTKKFDTLLWRKEDNNITLKNMIGKDIEIIFRNSIEVKYEIFKTSKSKSIELIQKMFIPQCKSMNF